MAMNKQRRTSNINNIITYDTLSNVTIPNGLTVKGLTLGYVKSNVDGLFSVENVLFNLQTVTNIGSATTNVITAAGFTLQGQELNSSTFRIRQVMAENDAWSIYGYATTADYGDLVFELQDNAAFVNGQRFRFYYGNLSSGVAKDILLIDYNGATFDGTLKVTGLAGIGTRMVVSDINGALSTQTLPTSTNIYNTSGSLTSARALTLGGFNLDFVGSTYTNKFTSAGRLLLGGTNESIYILDVSGDGRFKGNSISYDLLIENNSVSPYPETSLTVKSTNDTIDKGTSKLILATGSKNHTLQTWGAFGVLGLRFITNNQTTNLDASTLFVQRYTDRPTQLLLNFNSGVQVVGNITDEWIYIRAAADTNTSKAFRIVGTDHVTDKFTIYGDGTTLLASSITANSFIKSGGTSAQFLKADGSVDSSSYVTSNIYTSNGTLTSDRTVTIGNNSLAFSKTQTGLTGANDFVGTSIVAVPTTNASISWTASKGFFNYQGIFSPTFGGNITFQNSNYAGQELKINRITFAAASSTVTMTQASGGIRAFSNAIIHNYIDGTNNGTITHMASIAMYGDYASSSARFVVTNRYGLLINDFQEHGFAHTYTNRWAIYQAGANDNNYFKGKVIIGSSDTVGSSILNIRGLPTSATGLSTGDIWSNVGILTVV